MLLINKPTDCPEGEISKPSEVSKAVFIVVVVPLTVKLPEIVKF